MVRHAWLGPVDVSYLTLAKRVRDEAVAEAERDWEEALRLVAKELRVPDGVRVQLTKHPNGGVRIEWVTEDVVQESGRIAGDFNPNHAPSGAAE